MAWVALAGSRVSGAPAGAGGFVRLAMVDSCWLEQCVVGLLQMPLMVACAYGLWLKQRLAS